MIVNGGVEWIWWLEIFYWVLSIVIDDCYDNVGWWFFEWWRIVNLVDFVVIDTGGDDDGYKW